MRGRYVSSSAAPALGLCMRWAFVLTSGGVDSSLPDGEAISPWGATQIAFLPDATRMRTLGIYMGRRVFGVGVGQERPASFALVRVSEFGGVGSAR